jgi:hypothetical protein
VLSISNVNLPSTKVEMQGRTPILLRSYPKLRQSLDKMARQSSMLATVSMSIYFVLNLLVTVTSKWLQPDLQSAWLLTASHAATTFALVSLWTRISLHTRFFKEQPVVGDTGQGGASEHERHALSELSRLESSLHDHILSHPYILVLFAVLYTLNIVVSNWTLGLVSLTMHQTIRASMPALTMILSVFTLPHSWRFYTWETFGAVVLSAVGVVHAVAGRCSRIDDGQAGTSTTAIGFAWTLLGAVLAVIKTMASNCLQQPPGKSQWSLGLSSSVLLRCCSLCAIGLTLFVATCNGDLKKTIWIIIWAGDAKSSSWLWLWLANALGASLLNIASFEAVRLCGPLAMGLAGNLKQVAILLLDLSILGNSTSGSSWSVGCTQVVGGSLLTVIGGIWYSFAKRPRRVKIRSVEDGIPEDQRGQELE